MAEPDPVAPSSPDMRDLFMLLERVQEMLVPMRRVIVAFSGGVDSTLLARIARTVLGRGHVLAVTADSPSLSREDLAQARDLARCLDLAHEIVQTREMEEPGYQANSGRRCYFCKRSLFVELQTLAEARHYRCVLYGAIADDLPSERPGQQAAAERGVRAPLQEAGFSKFEIRRLARALGLPNWDRPQNACLSSRIPLGEVVTADKLRQVESAEAAVRALGFRQVRVRHFGAFARLEVGASEMARLNEPAVREKVVDAAIRAGFTGVEIDPEGYRSRGAAFDALDSQTLVR